MGRFWRSCVSINMNKYKKEKTFIINKLEDNPMKQLIIFITLIVVTLPQFGFAEEEV